MKIFLRLAITITFLFILSHSLPAGPVKSALKLLQKGKFEKLEVKLQKMLQKDSINSGARYVFSRLFIDTAYKHYSLDTAYIFILKSLANYKLESTDHLSKLHKDGLDSTLLWAQKNKIDSLAYFRASSIHTIIGYQYFLDTFLDAEQKKLATEARNELAFQAALKENTFESFLYFVQTYPNAHQVKDATQFYDILLYQVKTIDKKEKSYRDFLNEYPQSPYRTKAEEQIMLIATADNENESYQQFLEDYPNSAWCNRIKQLMFYNYDRKNQSEAFLLNISDQKMVDSLQQVLKLRSGFLIAILEKNKYGFIDQNGQVLIKPQFEELDEEMFCGQIEDELLTLRQNDQNVIVDRKGKIIIQGNYYQTKIEKGGLVKVEKAKKWGLIHITGFTILTLEFQQIVNTPNVIIAKQAGKWGVYSYQGRPLLGHDYDSIWMEGKMLIFQKDNKLAITLPNQIRFWADGDGFKEPWTWEELVALDKDYFLGLDNQDQMALLDTEGKELIKKAKQKISKTPFGWLISENATLTLLDHEFKPTFIQEVQKLIWNTAFLAIKKENLWSINVPTLSWFPNYRFDSLALLGEHVALAFIKDSTYIYFRFGKIVSLSNLEKIRLRIPFVSSAQDQNSVGFIETTNDKGFRKIYNSLGRLILTLQQEELSFLDNSIIVVDKKGKKALYDSAGQVLLQPKFDAIGNYQSGTVALLSNRLFGLYNLASKKTIPMEYDRLIKIYNEGVYIVGKNGKLGLINIDNKKLSDFTFDEIVFWTDSVALLKTGEEWTWKNIYSQALVYGPVADYKTILWKSDEKLIMVYKNGGYGIYHSKRGEIVAPTYNDLINLGSPEQPLYFAEKHVTEADFFVVLYLDAFGNILRKQVFTTEEYDLIYCN